MSALNDSAAVNAHWQAGQQTWINVLAVLQDLHCQQEREHELVGLEETPADIDEESIGEGLIQRSAALLYRFSLQNSSTQGIRAAIHCTLCDY